MKYPVDYSAFDVENPEKYKATLSGLPKFASDGLLFFLLLFLVFIGLPGFILLLNILPGRIAFVMSVAFPVFVFAAFKLLSFGNTIYEKQSIRLALFASKNKLSYGFKRRVKFVSPLLMNQGRGATLRDRITGHFQDLPFTFGFVIHPKRYKIMAVHFPANFPHIMLDCKANNFIETNLPAQVKELAKYNLEGNFDSYFQLYSQASAEDTLSLITPDIMEIIMDNNNLIDIELFGTDLVLFMPSGLITKKEMQASFQLLEALTPKLRHYAQIKTNLNLA